MDEHRSEYLELDLGELLRRSGEPAPDPGAGGVAALVASLAAGLVAMAARLSGEELSAAGRRAAALQHELALVARDDSVAFRAALRAERDRAQDAGEAWRRAVSVPVDIARLAAAVAGEAADAHPRAAARVRVDLAAAATLAAAAATTAAAIAAENAGDGEPLRRQAHDHARAAEAAAARVARA